MKTAYRLVIKLVIGLVLLGPASACSDEVCQEAEQKLRACLDGLNCNLAAPTERTRCVATKQQGEDALAKMADAPCTAEIADLAAQINRCDVNSVEFCDCF